MMALLLLLALSNVFDLVETTLCRLLIAKHGVLMHHFHHEIEETFGEISATGFLGRP